MVRRPVPRSATRERHVRREPSSPVVRPDSRRTCPGLGNAWDGSRSRTHRDRTGPRQALPLPGGWLRASTWGGDAMNALGAAREPGGRSRRSASKGARSPSPGRRVARQAVGEHHRARFHVAEEQRPSATAPASPMTWIRQRPKPRPRPRQRPRGSFRARYDLRRQALTPRGRPRRPPPWPSRSRLGPSIALGSDHHSKKSDVVHTRDRMWPRRSCAHRHRGPLPAHLTTLLDEKAAPEASSPLYTRR